MEQKDLPDKIHVLREDLIQQKYSQHHHKVDFKPFGEDGLSFLDFLDIINPLQHIPLISTLYRNLTGDEIDPVSKVAGSTLYGGPIGAVASLLDIMVEYKTGKSIVEAVLNAGIDDTQGMRPSETVGQAASLADPSITKASNQNAPTGHHIPEYLNSPDTKFSVLANFLPKTKNEQFLLQKILLKALQVNSNNKKQEYTKLRRLDLAYKKASAL